MWNFILLIACCLVAFFGGPTMMRALGCASGTGTLAAIVLAAVLFVALKSK